MAVVDKSPCPRCRRNGRDSVGDNLHHYDDGGKHCHACGYTELSDDKKAELGLVDDTWEVENVTDLTPEMLKKIESTYGHKGSNYRGVSDSVYEKYNVYLGRNESTNAVERCLYMVTTDGAITGVKTRIHPKQFVSVGQTGKSCDLFGRSVHEKSVSQFVVLTSGEHDALAAYQMINSNNDPKYEPIPVVSSTIGEGGVAQYQANYEWLDRFEKIIIVPDADVAGEQALHKAAKVLPANKLFVLELPTGIKDSNDALLAGFGNEFKNRFWRAKAYTPAGITSSTELEGKMLEYLQVPRITLPPFLHKLEKMLCGGIPLGYIVNLLSGSGSGKSTYVNEMIIHWVMNTNFKVGIVSLEASDGEYGVNLSSAFYGKKLNLVDTVGGRIELFNEPDFVSSRKTLFERPDGTPRFYLVDADIESMQSKIEQLVKQFSCKIVVLDPLQDVLDLIPEDKHGAYMKWQKDLVKREGVTIINVNHARKTSSGQKSNSTGADMSEEDIMGASQIFKSGAINIIFSRNKEADDPLEKNTTYVKVTKARGVGNTGKVGAYYYENEKHKLHDKDDWLRLNGGLGYS